MIFERIISRIISVAIGYIFGLFQTGYLYGKSKGIDIRTQGSGNAGTTNSLRVLGAKAGAITFIGDLLKAILAVLVVHFIFKDIDPEYTKLYELYAGFGAVLGHNFPFFLKFKGGKGIACSSGVILALCPWWFSAICLAAFIIIVVSTRYVSLGSITIMTMFIVGVLIFNYYGILGVEASCIVEFDIVSACFTAMAIFRHRANIVRLLHGNENKFSMKKK